jgi:hypothetical protein
MCFFSNNQEYYRKKTITVKHGRAVQWWWGWVSSVRSKPGRTNSKSYFSVCWPLAPVRFTVQAYCMPKICHVLLSDTRDEKQTDKAEDDAHGHGRSIIYSTLSETRLKIVCMCVDFSARSQCKPRARRRNSKAQTGKSINSAAGSRSIERRPS